MPNKRSNNKAKGKKARKSPGVPSTLQILPSDFKRVYLSYVSIGALTEAAAGTGTYYTFRLNSVYDPDFTGVGSTAIGFANLSSMYSLFRVVRARVITTFFMSTSGGAVVGLLPGLNSTYTATLSSWEAQPNATSKVILGNSGGARSAVTFDKTYDLYKLCAISKNEYRTDFDFSHSGSSNPAKSVFCTIYMRGYNSSAQTVLYTHRIVYEVEVSQPLQTLTA